MFPTYIPTREDFLKQDGNLVLILDHAQDPYKYFNVLLQRGEVQSHMFLACYEKTPGDILHLLAVKYRAGQSAGTFGDGLEGRLRWQKAHMLQYIASNASVLPKTLVFIAEHGSNEARQEVAENRSSPAKALSLLAFDPSSSVRMYAAGNPNTPLSVLKKMFARYKDFDDVDAIIGNPKSTLQMISDVFKRLMKLTAKEREETYFGLLPEALVSNPKTPKHVIDKLLEWEMITKKKVERVLEEAGQ